MSEENFTCSYDSIAFTLPFPPRINILEIVQKRLEKNPDKIGSKGPNCWLIYRAYYVFEYNKLASKKLSMTELSPHIAKAWGNESDEVKKEYQKIAAKVEEELIRQRKENLVYTFSNKRHSPPTIEPPALTYSETQAACSEPTKEIPEELNSTDFDISSWTLNLFNYASESPNNNSNIFTSGHTMTTDGNLPFHPDSTPPYHYQLVNSNLFFIPQYDNYEYNVNMPPTLLPAESYFIPIQSIYCVDGLYEDNYVFYDPLFS
ncbi:13650_t:CDS:2 [Racocetra fulgida]|uniref:13650_t:CDS:1 n=1 Tax=Racocetra fulgida TaxID=60492 RepID=A0A9N9EE90_9GLOM|nr:13650_t:CDS:2 [Racocetra fulgida]